MFLQLEDEFIFTITLWVSNQSLEKETHLANEKNLNLSMYRVILNNTEDMHLPFKQSKLQTFKTETRECFRATIKNTQKSIMPYSPVISRKGDTQEQGP